MAYQVIIIEDDPMVAAIDRQYVETDSRFQVAHVLKSGGEALGVLEHCRPDLIILDYYTPSMDGMEFVDRLHAMGQYPAIIMVTSANDREIVQGLLSRGVLDYLVKPFAFARLRQARDKFRQTQKLLSAEGEGSLDQQAIDRLIRRQEHPEPGGNQMSKGLNAATLERVRSFLSASRGQALTSEEIAEQVHLSRITIRRYVNGTYFSHIIGYTGKISSEELKSLNEQTDDGSGEERYEMNDTVGKSGIESVMETYLQGEKGSETIYVDNLGREIYSEGRVESVAGGNVYLTLDADLQEAVYNILEESIAGILLDKIRNVKVYNSTGRASDIIIPIDDVYFALFNNNVIDMDHLSLDSAGEYEKEVYQAFLSWRERVLDWLSVELYTDRTPYNQLDTEFQAYESYIVNDLLIDNTGVLTVDSQDSVYQQWSSEETLSLSEFLEYAIAQNWVDVTELDMEESFFDLIVNFRNTPAVERVAKLFSSNYRSNDLTLGMQTAVRKETGRKPAVCRCKDEEEVVDYVVSKIARNPEGSHGIIFPYRPQHRNTRHPSNTDGGQFEKYAALFEKKLKEMNIEPHKKFGEKGKGIVIKESGVYLVTDTVAKGLEFDNVYILNAETFGCSSEADRNRVYVSVTRAIENLYIIFSGSPATLRSPVYKIIEANEELFSREDPAPKQTATEWRID